MFFRLLIGTVVMLFFGYMGEALIINPWVGFGVGMRAKENLSPSVSYSFNLMRFIVSIGCSIYPLGCQIYDAPLNLIYNLADFFNKIYFCDLECSSSL